VPDSLGCAPGVKERRELSELVAPPSCPLFDSAASRHYDGAVRARSRTRTVEPLTTLGTRIPRGLICRLRVFCVQEERRLQDFVAEAVRERLQASRTRAARPPRPRGSGME